MTLLVIAEQMPCSSLPKSRWHDLAHTYLSKGNDEKIREDQ
jgi:hypothetical protein